MGVPYKGSYTCTNQGTADSEDSLCSASNLPSGVALVPGSCMMVTPPSETPTPWSAPSAIAERASVTCAVEGTPKEIGSSTVNGTGDRNDTQETEITIGAALPPVPVPSLSALATLMLSALLAALGFGYSRKRKV